MKKPETVSEAVTVVAEINKAIEEYYQIISKVPTVHISEDSLRTLKCAAELYVEKLGEMKVK